MLDPDCAYAAYLSRPCPPADLGDVEGYTLGDMLMIGAGREDEPALLHGALVTEELTAADRESVRASQRVSESTWAYLVVEFGDDGPELALEVASVIVALCNVEVVP